MEKIVISFGEKSKQNKILTKLENNIKGATKNISCQGEGFLVLLKRVGLP